MKKALFPVIALVVSTVCASLANAAPSPGPKLPGPSAVEAARLKKNPPPNYLSHYLPDDRYKIAGGVWKYVSTDLDTYYHIPSSPNMLRQPANRVIGFANARDAEEAGYVPDPTDGTAAKAAPANPVGSDKGLAPEELSYLLAVNKIQAAFIQSSSEVGRKFAQSASNGARQSTNANSVLIELRPRTLENVAITRTLLKRFNSLRPPARFGKFHSLRSKAFASVLKEALILDNAVATGDIASIDRIAEQNKVTLIYNRQANEELKRLSK